MLNKNFLSGLDCEVASTVLQEEDEQAWLAARTKGIGGSDVGTICGVNSFSCARRLFLKKTGQYIEGEFDAASTERMHFGNILEPVVADEYQRRTGNKVVVSPATYRHKEVKWALANIDRFIVDENGIPYGILECKTAGEYMKDKWDIPEDSEEFDIPKSYLYQLQWYLFVTGLKYGALACLVGGNKYYIVEVPYNEELVINEILPKVCTFWNYNVKQLIEPEYDGSDDAVDMVNKENSEVIKNSEISLNTEVYNELANAVFEGKKQIKELEKIVKEASNRIKDAMATHELGYTEDRIIKWSSRASNRFDSKAFKEDYPELYEKYFKKGTTRVFTVK